MKKCPECEDLYPSWLSFCERDGAELKDQDYHDFSARKTDSGEEEDASDHEVPGVQFKLLVQEDNTFVRQIQEEKPDTSACSGGGSHQPDETGWCEVCGMKSESPRAAYLENMLAGTTIAGICSRGATKQRNQDHMDMRVLKDASALTYVVAVCDGVSRSSPLADSASEIAALTACDFLEKSLGELTTSTSFYALLQEAIALAHKAVVRFGQESECSANNSPETTIALMVIHRGRAYYAWVGDCRIYWITEKRSGLLTYDHSYINEAVDNGAVLDEVMQAKYAHAITRALGSIDEAPEPSLNSFLLPEGVTIIACSDGLWNYMPEPEELATIVRTVPDYVNSLGLCRHLHFQAMTNHAPDGRKPGDDNITVVALAL